MNKRNQHLRTWLAVAFTIAVVAAPAAQAVGPDDRALYRGGDPALAPRSPSPDDRPFARADTNTTRPNSLSPDDRPFARSAPAVEPTAVRVELSSPRSFDWGDALIGAAFGLAAALLGLGAVVVAQRRRGTLRTA
jgi:hypothetical protein